ncbi:MAG: hypothetical protein LBK50_01760 [Candidatus Nomurabacteria bacterium]|jgi:hypothetical protein|nr:hypothetical protein [Candidatus Nomurabacteria bacterium]
MTKRLKAWQILIAISAAFFAVAAVTAGLVVIGRVISTDTTSYVISATGIVGFVLACIAYIAHLSDAQGRYETRFMGSDENYRKY